MGDRVPDRSSAAWGTLFIRLVLGGFLVAHGLLRLVPAHAEKAGEVLVTKDILGPQASVVFIGAGEIFVGVLLIIGLFVRFALLPVLVYFTAVVVHKVRAGEPLLSPQGSGAEEYLLLLCMAVGLLFLGPGRFSLQGLFSDQ